MARSPGPGECALGRCWPRSRFRVWRSGGSTRRAPPLAPRLQPSRARGTVFGRWGSGAAARPRGAGPFRAPQPS
eukprot:9330965-Lingulodinium_polyedra.AAC.1